MPLYKYTEKQHLNSFFNSGKLRVGTLYDYRDIVTHKLCVGDSNEGMNRISKTITNKNPVILSEDKNDSFFSEIFPNMFSGGATQTKKSYLLLRVRRLFYYTDKLRMHFYFQRLYFFQMKCF